MSAIKKIRRLLHLVERLQSGRVYNAKELSEFCEVSRRTIFRDIKTLIESGVPILYDAEQQGYWLATKTFLPPTNFTLSETLSLLILAQELSGENGIPFQQGARDATLKLQSNLPGDLRNYVGELTGAIRIRLSPQADLSGAQTYYDLCLQAVNERRRLRIRYDSLYEEQQIQTLLSPYRLLFLRHAWYVIGRSSLHRAVRTFHIGRVLQAELTDDSFKIPPRFSLKRYLGNAWNMIRERNNRQRVHIRFQRLVAQNVAEVLWHHTQELEWNEDGTLSFRVEVDGIHEISWWIMGYADQAEVLEPLELRELIAERVAKLAKIYKQKRPRKK